MEQKRYERMQEKWENELILADIEKRKKEKGEYMNKVKEKELLLEWLLEREQLWAEEKQLLDWLLERKQPE